MKMIHQSHISKIALIGAIALGVVMPSDAEAAPKKGESVPVVGKTPARPVIVPIPVPPVPIELDEEPASWTEGLQKVYPNRRGNGKICQKFYLDSAYRESKSSKVNLPGSPMVVKSVTGSVQVGDGAAAVTRDVVDGDIQSPTGPVTFLPVHSAMPGFAIPPNNHDQIEIAILRPSYAAWSSSAPADEIRFLRKGAAATVANNSANYLTLVLPARTTNEDVAPLPAGLSDANRSIAVIDVCVGPP